MLAPGGTPAAVVERLNAELNAILASPEIASRLAQQGCVARGGTAAEFAAFITSEQEK